MEKLVDQLAHFFSGRSRHTSLTCDWSSDVCSSDLVGDGVGVGDAVGLGDGVGVGDAVGLGDGGGGGGAGTTTYTVPSARLPSASTTSYGKLSIPADRKSVV